MPPSEPEIRQLTPQPALVEHASTDTAGLPAAVDRGFGALLRRLSELDVALAAPPYIRYLQTGERMQLELGAPVAAGTAALDGLPLGGLPGGRVAVLRHTGPYEQLRDACARLAEWLRRQGLEPAGPFWESYVTNPAEEPDPAKRITDICQPLR